MPRAGLRSAPALLALALFPLEREVANRSASGIALRLSVPALFPVLQGAFLVFLTVLGLMLVQSVVRAHAPLRELLGLPARSTAAREWGVGAALGWSIPLLSVLLLALSRAVQFSFWTGASASLLTAATLLGLLASSLAVELTFRGAPFRWLSDSIGQAWASLLLSALFALVVFPLARHSFTAFLVAMLLGQLLAVGWLRTHALWLSWGGNFAWMAALGVLFGLPVGGSTYLSTIVQADLAATPRLLGGAYGPEASPLTAVWLLLAVALLVRVTRDWAWHYTQPVLVPAGYPVEVPPPAAHIAAAPGATPPPPLVQILSTTPGDRSQTATQSTSFR